MSQGSPERPDGACLLCPPPDDNQSWRRPPAGYTVCDKCSEKLAERLTDIRDRYYKLNPRPGSNPDESGRGASGFGSRSPASDHIIVMRDWRSKSCEVAFDGRIYIWDPEADHGRRLPEGVHGPEEPPGAYIAKREVWFGGDRRPHSEQEKPPLSIPFCLSSLATLIAEDRDMTPPVVRRTQFNAVDQLVTWIDRQLDYVARQTWAVDLSDELRRLLAQLRPVTGDPPIKIGYCPNTIDEGEHSRECAAPLFAPTDSSKDDTIRCWSCGRKWPRLKWEELGKLMHDKRVEQRDCA